MDKEYIVNAPSFHTTLQKKKEINAGKNLHEPIKMTKWIRPKFDEHDRIHDNKEYYSPASEASS